MIDLHSHLLPGVDDGARTAEQALDALRMLAGHGVTDVVCTPHLRASDIPRSGAQAVARRDAVLAELRAAGPATPALHAGFEVLLDQPPTPLMVGNRQFALADSPYYLVEFRLSVVAHLATRILSEMARAGVIPLIAHVERYGASSPAVIAGWREAGARIQVDATTLTRPTSRGRLARSLVSAGLVDVLAADNHGDGRSLRTAARFLRERAADGAWPVDEVIEKLTRLNPRAVLDGRMMEPVPGIRIEEGWVGRVRRLFGR